MAYAVQLELFEENDEMSLTKRELGLVKKELTNVRKGMFAQLSFMKKEFSDKFNRQQEELDELKRKLSIRADVLKFPTPLRRKRVNATSFC